MKGNISCPLCSNKCLNEVRFGDQLCGYYCSRCGRTFSLNRWVVLDGELVSLRLPGKFSRVKSVFKLRESC